MTMLMVRELAYNCRVAIYLIWMKYTLHTSGPRNCSTVSNGDQPFFSNFESVFLNISLSIWRESIPICPITSWMKKLVWRALAGHVTGYEFCWLHLHSDSIRCWVAGRSSDLTLHTEIKVNKRNVMQHVPLYVMLIHKWTKKYNLL